MSTPTDLNKYIKKSHLKALDKFKDELEAFRQETGDEVAILYEDAFTSFTLADIRVENGKLCYTYDGRQDFDTVVREDDGEYWEDDLYGIMDAIRFWRRCLRRARRYWQMDVEILDSIQEGECEDKEEEEEEEE